MTTTPLSLDLVQLCIDGLMEGKSLKALAQTLIVTGTNTKVQALFQKSVFVHSHAQKEIKWNAFIKSQSSLSLRAFLRILKQAYEGYPSLEQLKVLEAEIYKLMEEEMESYNLSLSYKALLPTFLFYFPALLLLIFTPLYQEFIQLGLI